MGITRVLRWRLLLGTSFVTALVGRGWLDASSEVPGAWLFPLAMVLAALATGEVLWLLAAQDLRPLPWVTYAGTLLVVGSNAPAVYWREMPVDCPLGKLGYPLLALAVGVIVAFVGEMRRYEKPGGVIVNVALSIFAMCYVGLLLSFVIQLPLIGDSGQHVVPLATILVAVKMADIGAYTVGRLIGRHKMAPVLSPGKTWEGAAGGVVFACAGVWGLLHWLRPETPLWICLLLGGVLGIVGMLGDLAESLFKRDMGRKDSSAYLPGFGGVLDLLDSILIAAPVGYFLWIALMH